MRSHGVLFIFIGLISIILFWDAYFSNISSILLLNKLYIFVLLSLGMLVTVIGGILIGLGIKILFEPEIYEKIKKLIKE